MAATAARRPASAGVIDVQWNLRSEEGEKDEQGKIVEDNSSGHIDGKRLLIKF